MQQASLLGRITSTELLPLLRQYAAATSAAGVEAFHTSKGAHGVITLIGGSTSFAGAPFFAGISALRSGADMAHVITERSAAAAVKVLSPELMVHPYLPTGDLEDPDHEGQAPELSASKIAALAAKCVRRSEHWLQSSHALVIGPGLGRAPVSLATADAFLQAAADLDIPVVVDADALGLFADPERTSNQCLILTPNRKELLRLLGDAVTDALRPVVTDARLVDLSNADIQGLFRDLSRRFPRSLVVAKGRHDMIIQLTGTEPEVFWCSTGLGSPRRVGGQGDLLAGVLAAHAARLHLVNSINTPLLPAAAALAVELCRDAAAEAFASAGRAIGVPDILPRVGPCHDALFGQLAEKHSR
ncbi:YjeF [Fonticula alba]|uniref:ATP-dependent (S)-NAD(P)H-hydrate dehydratase n=1 Tax=Fonticula alba TaxID=691883 RepID=A0A058Z3M5_FONAL|nr:YjeF [Fonticula alba]KCV68488.1 YjeF [Fonticula alba]|eukprot:XP_009496920.1 YjeF [Fonticula alba]